MDDTVPKDIRFRARQWAIDLHAPDAGDALRRACVSWRAEHPQHEKAFREAQRVWAMLGALPQQALAPQPIPRRDRNVAWAARLAAAVAVCAVVSLYLLIPAGGVKTLLADVRTAPGERRTATLADGTQLQLNGATALSYRLDPKRRQIRLLAGEAYFNVAHDSSRPMVVEARDARVRVTGTRFVVRLTGDSTVLTLQEGGVAASRDGAPAEVRVRPNEQVVWQSGKSLQPAAADLRDALAWQRGRLIFKSRPLSEVIDELARYRRGRTFVVGDAGSELVTGVFDASDPNAVLAAAARTLGVKVVRVTPLLTIIF